MRHLRITVPKPAHEKAEFKNHVEHAAGLQERIKVRNIQSEHRPVVPEHTVEVPFEGFSDVIRRG